MATSNLQKQLKCSRAARSIMRIGTCKNIKINGKTVTLYYSRASAIAVTIKNNIRGYHSLFIIKEERKMKLKKALIVAFCVIIAALGLALTGCSSDKATDSNSEEAVEATEEAADISYEGTWKVTAADCDGVKVDDVNEFLGAVYITLNPDGTAAFVASGMVINGSWELTEDGFKFGNDDDSYTFVYKDGKLILDTETEAGLVTSYFEKEE